MEEPQADEFARLNQLDTHASLRWALGRISEEREQWSGIPMPLEDEALVIEPTYPRAQALMAIGVKPKPENERPFKIRNVFWSCYLRSDVVAIEDESGRVRHGVVPGANSLDKAMRTMACSAAWGIEQEHRALNLLGTLVRHHTFKQYLLTGSFLETSERSGVTYFFRKLRPTVAIGPALNGQSRRIMCTLCLHPIGYYADSWAGAMTPTDDVIAHLMLMRGDEAMFWRRANQTPAWRPEAGV